MVRVVKADNDITMTGKFCISGKITLIVAECTMREDNQRKISFFSIRIEKVSRYFTERTVSFKIICAFFVNENGRSFLNLKISVLGEVGRVGTINLQGDRFTLLDALAASGDLTGNSRLDRIGVIREYGDSRRIYWNDIRSKDIFLSPTFYLQQNDIIYVEPTGRKARNENRTNLYMIQSVFAFITSTISLILLFNKL